MANQDPKAGVAPQWLLGNWRLQRAEKAVSIMPGTRMHFMADGTLRYIIALEGREHLFELTFTVEDKLLRTENPDGGQQQAVRFACTDAGLLELDFAGARAWFAREWVM